MLCDVESFTPRTWTARSRLVEVPANTKPGGAEDRNRSESLPDTCCATVVNPITLRRHFADPSLATDGRGVESMTTGPTA